MPTIPTMDIRGRHPGVVYKVCDLLATLSKLPPDMPVEIGRPDSPVFDTPIVGWHLPAGLDHDAPHARLVILVRKEALI